MLPQLSFAKAKASRRLILYELKWLYREAQNSATEGELHSLHQTIIVLRLSLRRFPLTRKIIERFNPFRKFGMKPSTITEEVAKPKDPWFDDFFNGISKKPKVRLPIIDKNKKDD